jgi:hypothetical protein
MSFQNLKKKKKSHIHEFIQYFIHKFAYHFFLIEYEFQFQIQWNSIKCIWVKI